MIMGYPMWSSAFAIIACLPTLPQAKSQTLSAISRSMLPFYVYRESAHAA